MYRIIRSVRKLVFFRLIVAGDGICPKSREDLKDKSLIFSEGRFLEKVNTVLQKQALTEGIQKNYSEELH